MTRTVGPAPSPLQEMRATVGAPRVPVLAAPPLEAGAPPIPPPLKPVIEKICRKESPRRFLAPAHERRSRSTGKTFTQDDLDAFFRSLDATLFPSSPGVEEDAGLRRVWAQFWESRTVCFSYVLARLLEEHRTSPDRLSRAIDRLVRGSDGAAAADVQAFERSIARAILRRDRAALASFVGLRGVDRTDLCFALWHSHAGAWFELATAPSVQGAVNALTASTGGDGIERGAHLHEYARVEPGRFSKGPASGVKLYACRSSR